MVFDLFDADSLTSKDQTEIYFLSLVQMRPHVVTVTV